MHRLLISLTIHFCFPVFVVNVIETAIKGCTSASSCLTLTQFNGTLFPGSTVHNLTCTLAKNSGLKRSSPSSQFPLLALLLMKLYCWSVASQGTYPKKSSSLFFLQFFSALSVGISRYSSPSVFDSMNANKRKKREINLPQLPFYLMIQIPQDGFTIKTAFCPQVDTEP